MAFLPDVPLRHYRLWVARPGAVALPKHAESLWQALQRLSSLYEAFENVWGLDDELTPHQCKGPKPIGTLLAMGQIHWGEHRLVGDPSHRLRLLSGQGGDGYADLFTNISVDADGGGLGLWLEARIGCALNEEEEPAQLLRKMFSALIDVFAPEWGGVESPAWPEPAAYEDMPSGAGWLSYRRGAFELPPHDGLAFDRLSPEAILITAHPELAEGDTADMVAAVRRANELLAALKPKRSAAEPHTPASAPFSAPASAPFSAPASASGATPLPSSAATTAPPPTTAPSPFSAPTSAPATPTPPAAAAPSQRRTLEPKLDLGRTAPISSSRGPALPFRKPATEPTSPAGKSLEPHPELGRTALASPKQQGPTASTPFGERQPGGLNPHPQLGLTAPLQASDGETAALPPVPMDVADYARLTAASKRNPTLAAELRAQHGLDDASQQALDRAYEQRFQKQPRLRYRFMQLLQKALDE